MALKDIKDNWNDMKDNWNDLKTRMKLKTNLTSMEKGKIAEKLVKDMFIRAGFKVIKYGYEHTVPELADVSNLIKGKAGEYIRHQPDFIVINRDNKAFFIEVKHRSNYIIPYKEIFPYPNCYVLLLTKDFIFAQSTKYLFQKRISFLPLTKMPPFRRIPYHIIKSTTNRLKRRLGDEGVVGQFFEKVVKKITGKNLVKNPSRFKVIMEGHKRYRRSKK